MTIVDNSSAPPGGTDQVVMDGLRCPSPWRPLPPAPLVNGGHLLGDWPCTMPTNIARGSYVYVLMDARDRVCYVGTTTGLRSRLTRHGRNKPFTWWIAYSVNGWGFAVEARVIALTRPYVGNDGRELSDPDCSMVIDRRAVLRGKCDLLAMVA